MPLLPMCALRLPTTNSEGAWSSHRKRICFKRRMLRQIRYIDVSDKHSWSGGCMCGKVHFVAIGPASWVGICHCSSCRRATGGTLVTAAGFPRAAVTFTGKEPSTYASSAGVTRSFCSACGTSLSYQSEQWPEDIHLMAGAFDEPERLEPEFHIFADEKLPWLCLADPLPRFRTTPSAGDILVIGNRRP